jgi:protein-S-isoprenylcysteine O-methyltransferase Ste14
LQIAFMACLFMVILPAILADYDLIPDLNIYWSPYLFQFGFIVVFPSLIAVQNLVMKGKGTPFPYDPTTVLVRSGVYAYCRNPIQWSFTLMFIPMSLYFQSVWFLVGSLVSVAYTVGVSDYQEYPDLEFRFGKIWSSYIKAVPKWRFLWIPKQFPQGNIYFQKNCNQCEQVRAWFLKSKTNNLAINYSSEYQGNSILQVTYVDYLGNEFKSIEAIASALEHINLAWASLGWFMKLPLISQVLQAIINSMDFEDNSCDRKL